MTIPVNTFQDILNAMERNPALRDALRRYILTEELLQVPARLTKIEEDIGILKEGQARLEQRVDRLEQRFDHLEQRFDHLEQRFDYLEGRFDQLEARVDRMQVDLDRIGGDVSVLKGTDYESHVATYVHRFLRRNLGIVASVFSAQRNKSDLTKLLDEAEAQGIIEEWETDELDRADLVLTSEGPTNYILAEVSITVQQDDIDRAAERASLLAKATGQTVAPFAIGAIEQAGLTKGNVQVILIPEPRLP